MPDLIALLQTYGVLIVFAIVLVEQNVSMAMRVSHRACVLELGRLVAEGEPDELMQRPEIRKAYLGI